MAAPGKPEKTMSSRLLTMKFMQRASASPTQAPSPAGSTPPAKRQRTSNYSPSAVDISNQNADLGVSETTQLNSKIPFELSADASAETKWVLASNSIQKSIQEPHLNVVTAGYNVIDAMFIQNLPAREDDAGVSQNIGRRTFGKFTRKVQREQIPEEDATSSSVHDSSESEEGSSFRSQRGGTSTPRSAASDTADQIRAKRKARKKAQQTAALLMAENRRGKQVKLNKLASISSGGGGVGGGSRGSSPNIQCYRCGGKGHTKKNCPKSHDSPRR